MLCTYLHIEHIYYIVFILFMLNLTNNLKKCFEFWVIHAWTRKLVQMLLTMTENSTVDPSSLVKITSTLTGLLEPSASWTFNSNSITRKSSIGNTDVTTRDSPAIIDNNLHIQKQKTKIHFSTYFHICWEKKYQMSFFTKCNIINVIKWNNGTWNVCYIYTFLYASLIKSSLFRRKELSNLLLITSKTTKKL